MLDAAGMMGVSAESQWPLSRGRPLGGTTLHENQLHGPAKRRFREALECGLFTAAGDGAGPQIQKEKVRLEETAGPDPAFAREAASTSHEAGGQKSTTRRPWGTPRSRQAANLPSVCRRGTVLWLQQTRWEQETWKPRTMAGVLPAAAHGGSVSMNQTVGEGTGPRPSTVPPQHPTLGKTGLDLSYCPGRSMRSLPYTMTTGLP